MWTFGRKIAAGFAACFVLLLAVGGVAYRSIESLARADRMVEHTHQVIEHVVGALSELRKAESSQRGFFITGDDAYLEPYIGSQARTEKLLKETRALTADNPNQQGRLDLFEPLVEKRLGQLARNIRIRRENGLEATIRAVVAGNGKKTMDELSQLAEAMEAEEQDLLRQRAEEVAATSARVRATVVAGTAIGLVFVCSLGFLMTRSLSRQIGSAARLIQDSSAELQAAATQQLASAKESSTSVAEITATIGELRVVAREIAGRAQEVAAAAGDTADTARTGDRTVQDASRSIASLRQQVDLVVQHMLELGRKSRQIGAVLDLVADLSEQTNLLAINATIEAADAGESGRRFSVVAGEIRKLADRVLVSTKEIRALIDDVRGAVNTAVVATETGSKAVDEGMRGFTQVASVFGRIVGTVISATQTSREIEFSTQQQATALAQVDGAIGHSARAARETEVSSAQTMQTASALAGLSRRLLSLVQPASMA